MTKTLNWVAGALVAVILVAAAAPALAGYADDRAQIENLQARYMFAMDWRDADAYAATFAPDGVLDSAGGVEQGRQAIHDFIVKMKGRDDARDAADTSGKWPPKMRHSITNLVLEIHGDTASAHAYWTALNNNTDDRHGVIAGYGHYEDQLVKLNGQWLFKSRKIFNENLAQRHAPPGAP